MQVQLKTWGNSQGIRLPREILQIAGFSVNDALDIEASKGRIILTVPYAHKTLKERAAAYDGKLNLSQEIDWGEPVGNEVW